MQRNEAVALIQRKYGIRLMCVEYTKDIRIRYLLVTLTLLKLHGY